jgi:DNA primase
MIHGHSFLVGFFRMSSSFQFDVKDRIKQASDIVEWIGRDMELRRRGNKYFGLCPWHDDNRPSFEVNPNKQSFVCRVCDIRGDVFDYVMRREGVEFREALGMLAEKAGIAINRAQEKVVKGSANDKQALYRAMAWAEEVYHNFFLESQQAAPVRDYIQQRGIAGESVHRFRIGFAPLGFSWLLDRARGTEFSPEILEACGLVVRSERGSWYEPFRGRVIFPIRDTQQRPIALGGRVVPGIYGDQEEPRGKYVNSNETRLFSKSQNLYGLNLYVADLAAARERKLVIVEGYTDVIAAWQIGLNNVVAVLGTAINENHIRLLKRFADQVTLLLDGDEAGRKRANQVLDLFVANDLDLRIQTLPSDIDPFDFCLQQGPAAFQELVSIAPDAIGHKIRVETEGINLIEDTHAANRALENVLQTIATVPVQRLLSSPQLSLRHDQVVNRLARQFHIDAGRIRQRLAEIRSSQRGQNIGQAADEVQVRFDPSAWDRKEAELIQILIQVPGLLDQAMEVVPPGLFRNGMLKEIYQQMEEAYHQGESVSYEALMLRLEEAHLRAVLDHLYEESVDKLDAIVRSGGDRVTITNLFEEVLFSFRQLVRHSQHQATILQLENKQMQDLDETELLLELLKQTQQQQGLP